MFYSLSSPSGTSITYVRLPDKDPHVTLSIYVTSFLSSINLVFRFTDSFVLSNLVLFSTLIVFTSDVFADLEFLFDSFMQFINFCLNPQIIAHLFFPRRIFKLFL